jgi:hypothetical protein
MLREQHRHRGVEVAGLGGAVAAGRESRRWRVVDDRPGAERARERRIVTVVADHDHHLLARPVLLEHGGDRAQHHRHGLAAAGDDDAHGLLSAVRQRVRLRDRPPPLVHDGQQGKGKGGQVGDQERPRQPQRVPVDDRDQPGHIYGRGDDEAHARCPQQPLAADRRVIVPEPAGRAGDRAGRSNVRARRERRRQRLGVVGRRWKHQMRSASSHPSFSARELAGIRAGAWLQRPPSLTNGARSGCR